MKNYYVSLFLVLMILFPIYIFYNALLQDCDAFSIGFDESEVNKNHECEVLVMLSTKEEGIEMRYSKMKVPRDRIVLIFRKVGPYLVPIFQKLGPYLVLNKDFHL